MLIRGLGWFSIGLGLIELLIPRRVAKLTGVTSKRHGLIRLLGLREIASGVGIFTQSKPSGSLWSRVGGDMMDLTLLGTALTSDESERGKVLAATAAVAGVAALDVYASRAASDGIGTNGHAVHLEKSIVINRSPEEVYMFWRELENLPRFMNHLREVKSTGGKQTHWTANAPAGSTIEWDAEITEDRPHESIRWQSLPGSEVDTMGSVRFERATGGRGTVVRVRMDYAPPMGKAGSIVAKLFGESPELQIPVDLHRLKQFMETGEIATTEGQPAGRRKSTSLIFDDLLRK